MRLHHLQHEPFEGLGAIAHWAISRGFELSATHLYRGEALPQSLVGIDVLVVMGGSMSVNDEQELSWLVPEKQFVRQAIEAGKMVVGICLGAQMIANVLGNKVYKNTVKEIGWYPVQLLPEARHLPLLSGVPASFHVLHWHGETFDIPKGAIHLAKSEACQNQGFLYNGKVLGLQFHLEFDEASTDQMLANCEDELKEGPYVQSALQIREQVHHAVAAQKILFHMLDTLWAS